MRHSRIVPTGYDAGVVPTGDIAIVGAAGGLAGIVDLRDHCRASLTLLLTLGGSAAPAGMCHRDYTQAQPTLLHCNTCGYNIRGTRCPAERGELIFSAQIRPMMIFAPMHITNAGRNAATWRQRYAEDGHLLLRGLLDAGKMDAVRHAVLTVLKRHGFVRTDAAHRAMATDRAPAEDALAPDGPVLGEVAASGVLGRLSRSTALLDAVRTILGGDIFAWHDGDARLRIVPGTADAPTARFSTPPPTRTTTSFVPSVSAPRGFRSPTSMKTPAASPSANHRTVRVCKKYGGRKSRFSAWPPRPMKRGPGASPAPCRWPATC